MGCCKITLLIIFTVLQLAAIALGIAAAALPQWLDPPPRQITLDGKPYKIDNAGLWQVCIGNNSTRTAIEDIREVEAIQNSAQESFNQISSDDCKTGEIVEDFYKSRQYFDEDMYTEFMITRALTILFVLFAIIKLISILATKCREKPASTCAQCCVGIVNFIEGGAAFGTLVAFGLILQSAQEGDSLDGDVRDYWGIAYQMFLAAGVVAVVSNFPLCFICE